MLICSKVAGAMLTYSPVTPSSVWIRMPKAERAPCWPGS